MYEKALENELRHFLRACIEIIGLVYGYHTLVKITKKTIISFIFGKKHGID